MKIFILQKHIDGIANAHYVNEKAFIDNGKDSGLKKAIRYALKKGLKPLNFTSFEDFMKNQFQIFGLIPKSGPMTGKVETTYRIINMEVE